MTFNLIQKVKKRWYHNIFRVRTHKLIDYLLSNIKKFIIHLSCTFYLLGIFHCIVYLDVITFKKKFDWNFSSSLRGRRTVRFQCRQAESFPRAAWRGPCRRVSSRRGASSGAWQRPPTPPWLPTCRTLPSPHTPSCPSQTPPTPSSSLPPPPSTSPRCSVATSASPAGGGRRGRCFLTPSWRGWREGRQENVLVWGGEVWEWEGNINMNQIFRYTYFILERNS